MRVGTLRGGFLAERLSATGVRTVSARRARDCYLPRALVIVRPGRSSDREASTESGYLRGLRRDTCKTRNVRPRPERRAANTALVVVLVAARPRQRLAAAAFETYRSSIVARSRTPTGSSPRRPQIAAARVHLQQCLLDQIVREARIARLPHEEGVKPRSNVLVHRTRGAILSGRVSGHRHTRCVSFCGGAQARSFSLPVSEQRTGRRGGTQFGAIPARLPRRHAVRVGPHTERTLAREAARMPTVGPRQ